MLSFKVTYAIQILDILRHHDDGLLISELRNRFILLPNGTLISDMVRQMEAMRLIGCASSNSRRYRILVPIDKLTLYDLVRVMDDPIVLGTPVGFDYWSPGYIEARPHIADIENWMEESVATMMKGITIEELMGVEGKNNTRLKKRRSRTVIPMVNRDERG